MLLEQMAWEQLGNYLIVMLSLKVSRLLFACKIIPYKIENDGLKLKVVFINSEMNGSSGTIKIFLLTPLLVSIDSS